MSTEREEVSNNQVRARYWCFTIFGRDRDYNWKEIYEANKNKIRYLLIGFERAPSTSTLHWQGFVQLRSSSRLSALRKLLKKPAGKFFKCTGTLKHNQDYCKKSNDWQEFGNPVQHTAGKKMEHSKKVELIDEEVKQAWNGLNDENNECKSEWMINHGYLISTYKSTLQYIEKQKQKEQNEKYLKNWLMNFEKNNTLFEHQKQAINMLMQQDDRKILWIVDVKGSSGKSILAKYLSAKYNAFRASNVKASNIAFAYKGQSIIVFDLARKIDPKRIDYATIEDLKNGFIFSGKYESCEKYFKNPKIIIFSNDLPAIEMKQNKLTLTKDRLIIIDWSEHAGKCTEYKNRQLE